MTIKKSTILFFILLFPFLEPTVFDYQSGLIDKVFWIWKLFSIIYILFKYIFEIKKQKISKAVLFIVIYQFIRLMINIIHGLPINDLLNNVLSIIGFSCLIDYYIRRDPKMLINVLSLIFILFLILNCFSYNFDVLKYSTNIYFLGMRTRFTDMAYCLIVLSFLQYKFDNNKFRFAFSNILGIYNILMASVTTGIIGFLIFYTILIFLCWTKRKHINWYIPFLFSSIVFNILIVFYRIQEKFAYIIQEFFHKTLTFTGRTLIWNSAINKISDSKLLGHGFYDNGKFAEYRGIIWQAHNQILQIFYETGFVGLISFFCIFLCCTRELKSYKNDFNTKVILSGIIGISIMMISEILSIYIYFYLLIIIAYNIKYLVESDGKENEK